MIKKNRSHKMLLLIAVALLAITQTITLIKYLRLKNNVDRFVESIQLASNDKEAKEAIFNFLDQLTPVFSISKSKADERPRRANTRPRRVDVPLNPVSTLIRCQELNNCGQYLYGSNGPPQEYQP